MPLSNGVIVRKGDAAAANAAFSRTKISCAGADDGLRTGEALTQASEGWARREAKCSRSERLHASAENRHSCHRRYAVGCAYLLILRDERGSARYQRRLHQGRPREQPTLCLGDLATDHGGRGVGRV